MPLVHKCGKNIELATQEAPRELPPKGRSGVRDTGMKIVSGGDCGRGSGSHQGGLRRTAWHALSAN